ncbi:unnamed protein product [Hymenolepis diminuta]|uniref:Uncharacterized protein n=1 Tax=Hymenolepis diminuta TaxID=6216 RepID=A0A564XXM4_HYMDI|nr:unnamed protein product [Hymenolepis diminuta]
MGREFIEGTLTSTATTDVGSITILYFVLAVHTLAFAAKSAGKIQRIQQIYSMALLTDFDPFDYPSTVFLSPSSDQHETHLLCIFTKAAVFLTHCFYLGGYPTKWIDETDIFFSNPSPTIQLKIIPASWFAACTPYHIQAVNINNFGISETISRALPDSS